MVLDESLTIITDCPTVQAKPVSTVNDFVPVPIVKLFEDVVEYWSPRRPVAPVAPSPVAPCGPCGPRSPVAP